MLGTAEANGRIVRLVHGVWIASEALATDPGGLHLQLALAKQMQCSNIIAADHTAALAWGLDLPDDSAVDRPPAFIEPAGPGARHRSEDSGTIRPARLPRGHRVEHPSGLIVTTPARAAVDLAARLRLPEALIVLDSAARMELAARFGSASLRNHYRNPARLAASTAPLAQAAAVAATPSTRTGLVAAVNLTDPRRESALESRSYGHMVGCLPLPELQFPIETPGETFFVDFAWPQFRVVGEADGLVKYQKPEALHAEKLRQEAIENCGWIVVRWTSKEMRNPNAVLQRISRHLHR